MSSPLPTFAVSINAAIVDKPAADARGGLGRGWQSFELTEHEIAESILQGHAYAPQYRGGHRKTANFISAGFLAADVDAGRALDDALRDPFVRQHAAILHTTVSHTAERHRYRVILLLDEALTAGQDWADALLGLALAMNSDRSVADGARLFFGNTQAIMHHIGRIASAAMVADLIARGRGTRLCRTQGGELLPIDSARKIAGPEPVKVANGVVVRMDELQSGMRVHCPHHDDGDPSAFTVRSTKSGGLGIHCSACKATFWSARAEDGYDFGAFDRLFQELHDDQQSLETEAPGLDRFFPPAPRFVRYQRRFLPAIGYKPGITLVKSPKGSGKTEALIAMIQAIKDGKFPGDIPLKDRPKSVLLIGHRQSLIREAAAKLGLRCYLDPGDDADDSLRTFAVCLDSLPKYNESKGGARRAAYDLVIIDESEQVLSHLCGETIEKGRGLERCFDALMYEVTNAKAVIALDADLGLVTTHALRTMRAQDWASRCRIIYNAPMMPVQKRIMRLHKDRKFLEREVIETIKRGERCFIVSNSKKFIDGAHRMILNECGDGIVMRVVTSDNSRDEATIRFLANIKTEFLNVQVVLGTPSIGTGIDVTFLNGECGVDRVFGFFYPFVNTHTDIDQQLCRVRNPGAVDVWISPATFNFTSNVEVIKDDLARAYVVKRAVTGRREDGMIEYNPDDPLLMICAHVKALQRASKNRLVELFCSLREANGWAVERASEKAPTGPYDSARTMLEAERKDMLLSAPWVGDDEYIELDARVLNGAALSPEERITHERNRFERAVGLPLTEELVEMNIDGKLLDKIANFAEIMSILSSDDRLGGLVDAFLEPTTQPKGRLQGTRAELLLAVLMRAAGLTNTFGLNTAELLSVNGLQRFVSVCRANRTVIEEILGEPIRGDMESKPVRQLNLYLRRIGLELSLAKIEKVAARKIRYYALSDDLLRTMTRLAGSYLVVKASQEAENEDSLRERRKRQRPVQETGPDELATEDRGLLSPALLGHG